MLPRSASALSAAVEALVRRGEQQGFGLNGVHVVAGQGDPVSWRDGPDVRREIYSVSKTFTSVAVGFAAAEGLLQLDDLLLDHLPVLAAVAAPGTEAITVEHLLTMTSGIVQRWDEEDRVSDPAVALVAAPLGFTPGDGFAYRGGNTYLLARVIRACSGMDLRDFLLPRLFTPLDISEPEWERCPVGCSIGALGLRLRTEEIARLGRALLDDGRYDGQQVVPTDYVASLVRHPVDTGDHRPSGRFSQPSAESARYGRHVWLCSRDDAWRMDGIYGQFCIVLPHHRACITVTARYEGPTAEILDAVWETVVPACR